VKNQPLPYLPTSQKVVSQCSLPSKEHWHKVSRTIIWLRYLSQCERFNWFHQCNIMTHHYYIKHYQLHTDDWIIFACGRQCAPSSNMWFPRPIQLSIPNNISIGTAVFALHIAQSYTLQWATIPSQNCPLHVRSEPHLPVIHGSLGPPKSTSQMTSWSLQPFLQSSGSNRQTNRPCYSICNSRRHLRGITMQPKKTLFSTFVSHSQEPKSLLLHAVNSARFCFWCCDIFVCAWSVSRTAKQSCTKFTGKTCLVLRSDEFECQGQRPKVKVTRQEQKTAFFGPFSDLRAVYVW